jgi:hypothetical protein
MKAIHNFYIYSTVISLVAIQLAGVYYNSKLYAEVHAFVAKWNILAHPSHYKKVYTSYSIVGWTILSFIPFINLLAALFVPCWFYVTYSTEKDRMSGIELGTAHDIRLSALLEGLDQPA